MMKKYYMMLRDDDTNFYTSCGELEEGYGDLWGEVPITLATIPFVHGSERKILDFDTNPQKFRCLREWEKRASAEELSKYNELAPIGNNKNLVRMLIELCDKGKIEIAMHGVQHKFTETGCEMWIYKTSFDDVRAGKEYLEKVFNRTITTFIPPGNTLDLECAKNVRREGMEIVSSSTFKYKNKTKELISYFVDPYYTTEKLARKIRGFKPPIHKRSGIYITITHTLGIFGEGADENFMYNIIKRDLDKYGFSGLGTHYRLFKDDVYKKKYHSLVDRLRDSYDIEFLTAYDYINRIRESIYEK